MYIGGIETNNIPLFIGSTRIRYNLKNISYKNRSFKYIFHNRYNIFKRKQNKRTISRVSHLIASLIDIHIESEDTIVTIIGDCKYEIL